MRKRTKVLIWIIGIWIAIALFDFVMTQIVGHPVLCIRNWGGDMVMYIGLGYTIMVGYPLSPVGAEQAYYSYFYWPCIIIVALLIVFVVWDMFKHKKQQNEKEMDIR